MGFLIHKLLLDIEVSRCFQFTDVGREIAPRQPGLAFEEEEVRAVEDGEVGHDHEASGLVDYPVDFPE